MTKQSNTRTPSVLWAERKDSVFVTFNVPDCKNVDIKLTDQVLSFKGTSEGNDYACELKLKGKVNPDHEDTKYTVKGRNVLFHIMKAAPAEGEENDDEDGNRWNSLLENKKLGKNFVKADFDRWLDEDEEAESGGNGFDMSQMAGGMGLGGGMGGMGMPGMGGMGGMGGAGGMDMAKLQEMMKSMGDGTGGMPSGAGEAADDDFDSDDDDLPELEPAAE
eukprot:g4159.t1